MKKSLRAFKIENSSVSRSSSEIVSMLHKVLIDTSTADERKMKLNNQDFDEDLLAYYQWTAGDTVLFGMMMRIIPSEQGGIIPEKIFQNHTITIDDLSNNETNSSQYKTHFYFALNSEYLVTDLPGSYTIERLQTYLNWLLRDVRGERIIDITPLMVVPPDIQVKDIKSIEFSGNSREIEVGNQNFQKSIGANLNSLKTDVLQKIFGDTDTWSNIQNEQLVSAKLVLQIKAKPKNMIENDYQNVMGAIAKNISGDDGFAIRTRTGSIYKGEQIKKIKEIDVETTSKKRVVEEQLKQQMEKFLQELSTKE